MWNLAAFYLYLLAPPPWLAAAGVVALAALTFAPIRFVHPLRVQHLRALNVALVTACGRRSPLPALAANLRARSPDVTVAALRPIAIYFLVAGLLHRPA